MRRCWPGLLVAVVVGGMIAPARGQGGDAPAAPPPPPRIRIVDPEEGAGPRGGLPPIRIGERGRPRPAPRSPDVTEPPEAAEFIVIPLRAHVLDAADLPAVRCGLADADIRRVVAKVNGIWHMAGIHWALDPIVREPAADQDGFRAAQAAAGPADLGVFRGLAPAATRAEAGIDVYYIHAFAANGVYLGDRAAFVQETAELWPVPGGIDEPLPRVTAHELGHALGLDHRQDRTNLLASGTTGTILNRAEVARARARALRVPGAAPVPDLRRRLDEARGRGDATEAARLGAVLAEIPAAAAAADPAAPG